MTSAFKNVAREIESIARFAKHSAPALLSRVCGFGGQQDLISLNGRGYRNSNRVWEYRASNAYYGHSFTLSRYASWRGRIAATIVHGLSLGGISPDAVAEKYDLPCVITLSELHRSEMRTITDVPVFAIGPYISYATPFLSEPDYAKLKASLGKVLLVFPTHSLETTGVGYDSDYLIGRINELREERDVDTVLVCLYFADVAQFAHKYQDAGYLVTCAGHRLDKIFLSRLRSIIEVSDYCLTNDPGTHMGYAIALGKPCQIIRQDISRSFKDDSSGSLISPYWCSSRSEAEKQEICSAFSCYSETLTKAQLDIANKYWGVCLTKSPDVIHDVLACSKKVLARGRQQGSWASSFFDAAEEEGLGDIVGQYLV